MINKTLNETVRSIREKNLRKAGSNCRAHTWKEKDNLDGKVVNAGVMILPTKGCRWGRVSGCTMCGYVYEAGSLGDGELAKVFQNALDSLGDIAYLKLFTSGSFFDPEEVSDTLIDTIIGRVNEKGIEQFQVESRPMFLKEKVLHNVKSKLACRLEVGIGLETSNDIIRTDCINKGFSFSDYNKAVKLCKSNEVYVKTYLLLKPPFILEREAIEDTVKSALAAVEAGTNKVSINPMNIQRGTLVELLWKRGEYKTPWLWSLVQVLRRISLEDPGIPVLSHPTGGGGRRGVHNCGVCDSDILERIRKFSLEQDISTFERLNCSCNEHWQDYLLLE